MRMGPRRSRRRGLRRLRRRHRNRYLYQMSIPFFLYSLFSFFFLAVGRRTSKSWGRASTYGWEKKVVICIIRTGLFFYKDTSGLLMYLFACICNKEGTKSIRDRNCVKASCFT